MSQPIFGPEISAIKLSNSVPIGTNSEFSSSYSMDGEMSNDNARKVKEDHKSAISKRSLGSPVTAARRVEPRFEDYSVNNTLVTANIGESVALHCRIWMKQVRYLYLK